MLFTCDRCEDADAVPMGDAETALITTRLPRGWMRVVVTETVPVDVHMVDEPLLVPNYRMAVLCSTCAPKALEALHNVTRPT